MNDCIFCKIMKGEIPSDRVYENERLVCFRDIHPVTPVHVLIVPREHIRDMNELAGREDAGEILKAVAEAAEIVAEKEGIRERGYRLINNCGAEAGQSVPHLHFHLLGGKVLGETLI